MKPMDGIDHVLFPSNPATADNVVLYIYVVLFALWTACSIICVVMLLFINCCQKSNNIFSVLFILFQLITLLNRPKSDQPNRGIVGLECGKMSTLYCLDLIRTHL